MPVQAQVLPGLPCMHLQKFSLQTDELMAYFEDSAHLGAAGHIVAVGRQAVLGVVARALAAVQARAGRRMHGHGRTARREQARHDRALGAHLVHEVALVGVPVEAVHVQALPRPQAAQRGQRACKLVSLRRWLMGFYSMGIHFEKLAMRKRSARCAHLVRKIAHSALNSALKSMHTEKQQ